MSLFTFLVTRLKKRLCLARRCKFTQKTEKFTPTTKNYPSNFASRFVKRYPWISYVVFDIAYLTTDEPKTHRSNDWSLTKFVCVSEDINLGENGCQTSTKMHA